MKTKHTIAAALTMLTAVSGCAHHPRIDAIDEPFEGSVVFTLERDAWFASDGTFADGPRFAPTLQTEGSPPPHVSVGFVLAGERLEVVSTFRVRYRDGERELWGIATTADPENCGLFVSIPLRLGSGTHPFFPGDALSPLTSPPRYGPELHSCAAQRWRAHDFGAWVPGAAVDANSVSDETKGEPEVVPTPTTEATTTSEQTAPEGPLVVAIGDRFGDVVEGATRIQLRRRSDKRVTVTDDADVQAFIDAVGTDQVATQLPKKKCKPRHEMSIFTGERRLVTLSFHCGSSGAVGTLYGPPDFSVSQPDEFGRLLDAALSSPAAVDDEAEPTTLW